MERIRFSNGLDEELVGIIEGEGERAVVLCHCFTCSKDHKLLKTLADALCDAGFTTLRFDFSGNGESEGSFGQSTYSKQVGDLHAAVSYLASRGFGSIGVCGHSMGGTVAILESCEDERVKAVATFAAPSSTQHIRDLFTEENKRSAAEKGEADVVIFGKEQHICKAFFDDAVDHDVLGSINTPLCVVQGTADRIVWQSCGEELGKKATEMHLIDGADHFFAGHENEVIAIAAEWFSKKL